MNVHNTCTAPASIAVPTVQIPTSRSSTHSADKPTHHIAPAEEKVLATAAALRAPGTGFNVCPKRKLSQRKTLPGFSCGMLGCAGRTVQPRVAPPSRRDNSPAPGQPGPAAGTPGSPRAAVPPGPSSATAPGSGPGRAAATGRDVSLQHMTSVSRT